MRNSRPQEYQLTFPRGTNSSTGMSTLRTTGAITVRTRDGLLSGRALCAGHDAIHADERRQRAGGARGAGGGPECGAGRARAAQSHEAAGRVNCPDCTNVAETGV